VRELAGVATTTFRTTGRDLAPAVACIFPPPEPAAPSGGASSEDCTSGSSGGIGSSGSGSSIGGSGAVAAARVVCVGTDGRAAGVIAQEVAPAAPGSAVGCPVDSTCYIWLPLAGCDGEALVRVLTIAGSGCRVSAAVVDPASGEALEIDAAINISTLVISSSGEAVPLGTALSHMVPGIRQFLKGRPPRVWGEPGGQPSLPDAAYCGCLPPELHPPPLQQQFEQQHQQFEERRQRRGRQQQQEQEEPPSRPAIVFLAAGHIVAVWCQPYGQQQRRSAGGHRVLVDISTGTRLGGVLCSDLLLGPAQRPAQHNTAARQEVLQREQQHVASGKRSGSLPALLPGTSGMYVLDQQGGFVLSELWHNATWLHMRIVGRESGA